MSSNITSGLMGEVEVWSVLPPAWDDWKKDLLDLTPTVCLGSWRRTWLRRDRDSSS